MEAKFLPVGFNINRFMNLMENAAVDGVLIASPENVSYLTGYPCVPSSGNPILFAIRNHYPFYAYINKKGETFLIAWEYSLLDIDLGVDHLIKHVNKDLALKGLSELLQQELGLGGNLGLESTCPFQLTTFIQDWVSPAKFTVVDEILDQLRLIKSPTELSNLRKSCQIVEQTFLDILPIIKPGLYRSDLIKASKAGMIHNGASGIGHCTISFGASNPEVEINEALEKDRLVIIDLGGMYYGYASDIRRMLYSGRVPEKMKQLHAIMCNIVETLGNAIVPGVEVKDLCVQAELLFIRNGLESNFTHIGHTMGLQTEEVWCDRKNKMKFEPGMVVNIELYSMMSSGENIGDEETYIVTSSGSERITQLPREIRAI